MAGDGHLRLLAASAVLERAGAEHIERKLQAAPWWELRRRARLRRELRAARSREREVLVRLGAPPAEAPQDSPPSHASPSPWRGRA